jgi:hypothetical protein
MRESARQDAEAAQMQLEEMQATAPDRIQEAYRRGAPCTHDSRCTGYRGPSLAQFMRRAEL